ncbi:MAG: EAL domain-containing protein [Nitratireductor sp.]
MFRRHVVLRFLGLFVPVFAAFSGVLLYALAQHYVELRSNQLGARIGNHMGRVSTLLTADMLDSQKDTGRRLLSTLLADPAVTCVGIFSENGEISDLQQPRRLGCEIMRPEDMVRTTIPAVVGGEIAVGFTKAEIHALTSDAWRFTLLTTVVGLLAAGSFGWYAFRSSVGQPVRELLAAVKDTEQGKFVHAPVRSTDEIGTLCSAFNVMQDRLQEERNRTLSVLEDLRNAYDTTPALLFTMSVDGLVMTASEYWIAQTGYNRSEVLGAQLETLLCPESKHPFSSMVLEELRNRGSARDVPLRFWYKDGTEVEVLLSAVPDRRTDAVGSHFVCIMNDVSQLRRTEESLRRLAATDPLTKMPNRNGLTLHLEGMEKALVKNPSGWAVLFIDLDNFKTINDTFGHAAGDTILLESASRIAGFEGANGFAARIGGDEFALILQNLKNPLEAEKVARGIVQAVSQPVDLNAGTGKIGASIGIAYCDDGSIKPYQALSLSDQAMYLAKSEGKNRVCFYEESRAAVVRSRSEQVQMLHHAMANHCFEVFLQPVVNMITGEPYAFEALLRTAPMDGFTGSIENMIRTAEESGNMEMLGDWIMDAAAKVFCDVVRDCDDRDMLLSINLSPRQLVPGFTGKVAGLLYCYGELEGRLVFEITETAVMENFEPASLILAQLRQMGILIAIDDFGTGQSSLSYITHLPADIIKLDRSFVIPHERNATAADSEITMRRQAYLMKAVAGLASELDLRLVAEGIEQSVVRDRLCEYGISFGQGYLFSRPLPGHRAKDWLRGTIAAREDNSDLKRRRLACG